MGQLLTKKHQRRLLRYVLQLLVLVVLAVAGYYTGESFDNTNNPDRTRGISDSSQAQQVQVVQVVDGDTVKVLLANEQETVRLIGLDTPELARAGSLAECFAAEAKQTLTELVEGQTVELVADSSQAERDRYGRLLGYLFLATGENVAQVLIASGYGHEYTYQDPYLYQQQFRQAEIAAREQRLGLWGATCR